MIYISQERLREKMNRAGNDHTPFVWGIDYAGTNAFFIDNPLYDNSILWEINGIGNIGGLPVPASIPTLSITAATRYDDYRLMFDTVKDGLMRGDSFLANLTAPTRVTCDGSLRDIFLCSSAPFRLLLDDTFVCFSPEPFVCIDNGRISAFPMKGTIDATLPDALSRLMDDYKETCEHNTIVDLMRNDLNRVATHVSVTRFRYADRIDTSSGAILQTSSEITGIIPPDRRHNLGDIILPLLPAGSITGAPKPATVALIDRAETSPRGWYTGVFGYFDGSTMETAVMIRCIQRHADGNLYFHSGGGITVNSDCREEYDELLAKVYLTSPATTLTCL